MSARFELCCILEGETIRSIEPSVHEIRLSEKISYYLKVVDERSGVSSYLKPGSVRSPPLFFILFFLCFYALR